MMASSSPAATPCPENPSDGENKSLAVGIAMRHGCAPSKHDSAQKILLVNIDISISIIARMKRPGLDERWEGRSMASAGVLIPR